MPTNSDWGMGWAIAAYAITWLVLILYARYVSSRSKSAQDALEREARRAGSES